MNSEHNYGDNLGHTFLTVIIHSQKTTIDVYYKHALRSCSHHYSLENSNE